MYIRPEKVTDIFMDCLFHDDELPADGSIPSDAVLAEGIVRRVGFHKQRLDTYTDELNDLIDHWNANLDRGVSFLVLCDDITGEQWGEHDQMEQLLLLGLAIDRLTYCFPKELSSILPGGMPYIMNRKIDIPPTHVMYMSLPDIGPELE